MTIAHAYRDGTGVHSGQISFTNAYDAAGRRVSRTVTGTGVDDCTDQYYYSGNQAIQKRDGSDELLQEYVYGLTYVDEICQVAFNSSPDGQSQCDFFFWMLQDANYDVVVAVDAGAG